MNSVSWFLYLSDVVSNLRDASTVILIGGIFVAVGGTIFLPLIAVMADDLDWLKPYIPATAKYGAITWLGAGLIFMFVPAKNTMYAIAASEVGEKIAHSDQAREIASDATKALQQWIKKQIEPEQKK